MSVDTIGKTAPVDGVDAQKAEFNGSQRRTDKRGIAKPSILSILTRSPHKPRMKSKGTFNGEAVKLATKFIPTDYSVGTFRKMAEQHGLSVTADFPPDHPMASGSDTVFADNVADVLSSYVKNND